MKSDFDSHIFHIAVDVVQKQDDKKLPGENKQKDEIKTVNEEKQESSKELEQQTPTTSTAFEPRNDNKVYRIFSN